MASIDRSDPIIMGHVLAEHQELFQRMAATRSRFSGESPAAEQMPPLLECLRALRDHLAEHFLQEERGGFLEEAVARMPRLGPSVSALVAQHPGLLDELDKIIASLPSSSPSAAAWQQMGQSFATFAAHMMAHERSEHAVVQEGYNEDLGLVD